MLFTKPKHSGKEPWDLWMCRAGPTYICCLQLKSGQLSKLLTADFLFQLQIKDINKAF